MKVTVYNLKRESVGELDLSDEVFGAEVKEQLFYEVVKAQLASRRSGTKATKERSAVSGSSKKLYRQKGTGRARQGSLRAPHHPGGGMAHAIEPKDWSYRPPRKVRIGALKSALSMFAKEGRLIVLDSLELPEIKTKALLATLGTLQVGKKSLVVDVSSNDKLVRSIRNLENHQFLPPEGVNVYDLLRHDHLVVSKEAAKALEARCLKKSGDASDAGTPS
jgi:large subunit ribosomal protein L4